MPFASRARYVLNKLALQKIMAQVDVDNPNPMDLPSKTWASWAWLSGLQTHKQYGAPQKEGGCKRVETAMEDVMSGYCLQLQGIEARDTRDTTGAERFHLLSPAHTLQLRYRAHSNSHAHAHGNTEPILNPSPGDSNSGSGSPGAQRKEGWIAEYTARFQPKDGLAGISASSVSFHYVKAAEQRTLARLIYDCRK